MELNSGSTTYQQRALGQETQDHGLLPQGQIHKDYQDAHGCNKGKS